MDKFIYQLTEYAMHNEQKFAEDQLLKGGARKHIDYCWKPNPKHKRQCALFTTGELLEEVHPKKREIKKVIWLTGLSSAGKTTIAEKIYGRLSKAKYKTILLDGDVFRKGISKDLGFTPADRQENIRRVSEIAKLFYDENYCVITAFVSPYAEDRGAVRKLFPKEDFIEVFIDCPLEVCEERDAKGLYKKARAGLIADFTGISSPYDSPEKAEIVLDTSSSDMRKIRKNVQKVLDYLE